ncbi:unnamed protein product, partial [Staurois parvus]
MQLDTTATQPPSGRPLSHDRAGQRMLKHNILAQKSPTVCRVNMFPPKEPPNLGRGLQIAQSNSGVESFSLEWVSMAEQLHP